MTDDRIAVVRTDPRVARAKDSNAPEPDRAASIDSLAADLTAKDERIAELEESLAALHRSNATATGLYEDGYAAGKAAKNAELTALRAEHEAWKAVVGAEAGDYAGYTAAKRAHDFAHDNAERIKEGG